MAVHKTSKARYKNTQNVQGFKNSFQCKTANKNDSEGATEHKAVVL